MGHNGTLLWRTPGPPLIATKIHTSSPVLAISVKLVYKLVYKFLKGKGSHCGPPASINNASATGAAHLSFNLS